MRDEVRRENVRGLAGLIEEYVRRSALGVGRLKTPDDVTDQIFENEVMLSSSVTQLIIGMLCEGFKIEAQMLDRGREFWAEFRDDDRMVGGQVRAWRIELAIARAAVEALKGDVP